MAFNKKNINEIIRTTILVLFAFPLVVSSNIDCGGKAFHCVNSTHFMICVDLGGGVSSTIDTFIIPCPPPTVCQKTNYYECEIPLVTTTVTSIDTSVPSASGPSANANIWDENTVSSTPPNLTSEVPLTENNTVSITAFSIANQGLLTFESSTTAADAVLTTETENALSSLSKIQGDNVSDTTETVTSAYTGADVFDNLSTLKDNVTDNLIDTTTDFTTTEYAPTTENVLIATSSVQTNDLSTDAPTTIITIYNEASKQASKVTENNISAQFEKNKNITSTVVNVRTPHESLTTETSFINDLSQGLTTEFSTTVTSGGQHQVTDISVQGTDIVTNRSKDNLTIKEHLLLSNENTIINKISPKSAANMELINIIKNDMSTIENIRNTIIPTEATTYDTTATNSISENIFLSTTNVPSITENYIFSTTNEMLAATSSFNVTPMRNYSTNINSTTKDGLITKDTTEGIYTNFEEQIVTNSSVHIQDTHINQATTESNYEIQTSLSTLADGLIKKDTTEGIYTNFEEQIVTNSNVHIQDAHIYQVTTESNYKIQTSLSTLADGLITKDTTEGIYTNFEEQIVTNSSVHIQDAHINQVTTESNYKIQTSLSILADGLIKKDTTEGIYTNFEEQIVTNSNVHIQDAHINQVTTESNYKIQTSLSTLADGLITKDTTEGIYTNFEEQIVTNSSVHIQDTHINQVTTESNYEIQTLPSTLTDSTTLLHTEKTLFDMNNTVTYSEATLHPNYEIKTTTINAEIVTEDKSLSKFEVTSQNVNMTIPPTELLTVRHNEANSSSNTLNIATVTEGQLMPDVQGTTSKLYSDFQTMTFNIETSTLGRLPDEADVPTVNLGDPIATTQTVTDTNYRTKSSVSFNTITEKPPLSYDLGTTLLSDSILATASQPTSALYSEFQTTPSNIEMSTSGVIPLQVDVTSVDLNTPIVSNQAITETNSFSFSTTTMTEGLPQSVIQGTMLSSGSFMNQVRPELYNEFPTTASDISTSTRGVLPSVSDVSVDLNNPVVSSQIEIGTNYNIKTSTATLTTITGAPPLLDVQGTTLRSDVFVTARQATEDLFSEFETTPLKIETSVISKLPAQVTISSVDINNPKFSSQTVIETKSSPSPLTTITQEPPLSDGLAILNNSFSQGTSELHSEFLTTASNIKTSTPDLSSLVETTTTNSETPITYQLPFQVDLLPVDLNNPIFTTQTETETSSLITILEASSMTDVTTTTQLPNIATQSSTSNLDTITGEKIRSSTEETLINTQSLSQIGIERNYQGITTEASLKRTIESPTSAVKRTIISSGAPVTSNQVTSEINLENQTPTLNLQTVTQEIYHSQGTEASGNSNTSTSFRETLRLDSTLETYTDDTHLSIIQNKPVDQSTLVTQDLHNDIQNTKNSLGPIAEANFVSPVKATPVFVHVTNSPSQLETETNYDTKTTISSIHTIKDGPYVFDIEGNTKSTNEAGMYKTISESNLEIPKLLSNMDSVIQGTIQSQADHALVEENIPSREAVTNTDHGMNTIMPTSITLTDKTYTPNVVGPSTGNIDPILKESTSKPIFATQTETWNLNLKTVTAENTFPQIDKPSNILKASKQAIPETYYESQTSRLTTYSQDEGTSANVKKIIIIGPTVNELTGLKNPNSVTNSDFETLSEAATKSSVKQTFNLSHINTTNITAISESNVEIQNTNTKSKEIRINDSQPITPERELNFGIPRTTSTLKTIAMGVFQSNDPEINISNNKTNNQPITASQLITESNHAIKTSNSPIENLPNGVPTYNINEKLFNGTRQVSAINVAIKTPPPILPYTTKIVFQLQPEKTATDEVISGIGQTKMEENYTVHTPTNFKMSEHPFSVVKETFISRSIPVTAGHIIPKSNPDHQTAPNIMAETNRNLNNVESVNEASVSVSNQLNFTNIDHYRTKLNEFGMTIHIVNTNNETNLPTNSSRSIEKIVNIHNTTIDAQITSPDKINMQIPDTTFVTEAYITNNNKMNNDGHLIGQVSRPINQNIRTEKSLADQINIAFRDTNRTVDVTSSHTDNIKIAKEIAQNTNTLSNVPSTENNTSMVKPLIFVNDAVYSDVVTKHQNNYHPNLSILTEINKGPKDRSIQNTVANHKTGSPSLNTIATNTADNGNSSNVVNKDDITLPVATHVITNVDSSDILNGFTLQTTAPKIKMSNDENTTSVSSTNGLPVVTRHLKINDGQTQITLPQQSETTLNQQHISATTSHILDVKRTTTNTESDGDVEDKFVKEHAMLHVLKESSVDDVTTIVPHIVTQVQLQFLGPKTTSHYEVITESQYLSINPSVTETKSTQTTLSTTPKEQSDQNMNIHHSRFLDTGSKAQNPLHSYCHNRGRGRYSDRDDCTKFYICIGRSEPIVGKCPVNTVFSDLKKQCTKNKAHCIRNNEFKCVSEGRFSDILKQNVYYICVNRVNVFVRFEFQCQDGYVLNQTSVRCTKEETHHESTDKSKSETSSSETTNSKEIKSKNHSTSEKDSKDKTKHKFECSEEGKFVDPRNCKKYYVCTKNKKSQFRRKRKSCDSDELFHKDKKKCVDADSYDEC